MRRYLIVANQTLGGTHLARKVGECMASGPCAFYVVVPATPPQEWVAWTERGARAVAELRLERALARFRALGAAVEGEVGDPDRWRRLPTSSCSKRSTRSWSPRSNRDRPGG